MVTPGVLCIREAWNEFAFARPGDRDRHAHGAYRLQMLKDAMGVQDYAVYNASRCCRA